jgi:uncharacterized RDD family membrane protein YckC
MNFGLRISNCGFDCAPGQLRRYAAIHTEIPGKFCTLAVSKKPDSDNSYAGIVRRAGAYLVDCAVMTAAFAILQTFLFLPLRQRLIGSDEWLMAGGVPLEIYTLLTISLPTWLYFAWSEQSIWQATIGKRVFRLTVTDLRGDRIGFGRAMLRTVIKLLPWEISHLTVNLPTSIMYEPEPKFRFGFLVVFALLVIYPVLILLTRRRQSLHDLIAKTIVLYGKKKHNNPLN